ncbi:serine threonine protein kinase, partial [Aspergillus sclerotialis]
MSTSANTTICPLCGRTQRRLDLGVILVNLTCGRNPWKKASPDDSTFRAFLKDPKFLSSILPISPELNMILRRIFECDPHKRITLQELR